MSSVRSRAVRVVERPGYVLTNHRALCRRGVMWIGQTCNLRCHFCYFLDKINDTQHPEHSFLPLPKLKEMCRTLVDVYGNNSVDIQGGEPTIYRDILPLIRYCNEIGLKPTLITNGFSLANKEKCKELQDAGVYDLLISVHAMGANYDKIVCVPGAARKLEKAIVNLSELQVPFRFNTVLCKEALPDLMDIAKLGVASGARAVNFIAFNPFIDQSCGDKRNEENVPRYSDIVDRLIPVIDLLDANGIEVNVRYLPFCLFPEKYRKFIQNFQQIVYDLHEWESAGEAWTGASSQREAAAPLSQPLNFFKHIEAMRVGSFGKQLEQLPVERRWSPSVRAAVDALEVRVRAARSPLTVSVFGSAEVGRAVIGAAGERESLRQKVSFVAFISSSRYRLAETLHGLRWETPEWLAANPSDLVLNTSESSRASIGAVLAQLGLSARTIDVFAAATPGEYEYLPYLQELGPVGTADTLEQAYKEYRVLMPKTIHPYSKGSACESCALVGICDGFHRDYAGLFGFHEAESQKLQAPVYDPCFYSCEQMKVVEEQEFGWALPPEYRPVRTAA